jgi:hypothetical protein
MTTVSASAADPVQEKSDIELAALSRDYQFAGQLVAGAVLYWQRWCHRKVEAIALLEGERARRRISVDCTPTGIPWPPNRGAGRRRPRPLQRRREPKQVVVPLTFVAKQPMRSLDVVDDQGRSVPVLGRHDNGNLAAAALEAVVTAEIERPVTTELRRELFQIACGDSDFAGGVAARVIADLNLADLAAAFMLDLARNFLFCVVMPSEAAGARQVVKYSYHWESGDVLQPAVAQGKHKLVQRIVLRWRRTAAGLGLNPFSFALRLGSPNSAASYHLEVPAPPGLVCASVTLPPGTGGAPTDNSTSAFGHAYDSYESEPAADASIEMNMSPHGLHLLVTLSALGTFVTFFLAVTLPNALHTLGVTAGGAAALLLFGPASLLALVAGKRENVVAGFILLPLRIIATSLSGLLFVAGATLVGSLHHPWITGYWVLATVLSGVSAILLACGTVVLRQART